MPNLYINNIGSIKFSGKDAATVPTPETGDSTFFLDSVTGDFVSKSDTGIVSYPVKIVILQSDVINNNVVANTLADVTGLSFSVVAGLRYKFKFTIRFTSAASTTGSRWTINGPATTFLQYRSQYTLSATSVTTNELSAYNVPAAANASSVVAGGLAIIQGIIKPSANGNIIARFASEITASAITAKAESFVEYQIY